ncbi:hypothetical protein FMEAI12_3460006 [Parafrankia sp. Ea1.12]|nr:hypothetical protein FMEAI12_3460006 [Parafrankia sp. Ea1.12]
MPTVRCETCGIGSRSEACRRSARTLTVSTVLTCPMWSCCDGISAAFRPRSRPSPTGDPWRSPLTRSAPSAAAASRSFRPARRDLSAGSRRPSGPSEPPGRSSTSTTRSTGGYRIAPSFRGPASRSFRLPPPPSTTSSRSPPGSAKPRSSTAPPARSGRSLRSPEAPPRIARRRSHPPLSRGLSTADPVGARTGPSALTARALTMRSAGEVAALEDSLRHLRERADQARDRLPGVGTAETVAADTSRSGVPRPKGRAPGRAQDERTERGIRDHDVCGSGRCDRDA